MSLTFTYLICGMGYAMGAWNALLIAGATHPVGALLAEADRQLHWCYDRAMGALVVKSHTFGGWLDAIDAAIKKENGNG
jgi:hypothetical protein